MAIAPAADADRLLEDLNEAQREAVVTTRGPLAILAGAGTGKTRVISRRAAYAIATGVVAADQVLVVTFTDKAAGEMVERLAGLGLPGVVARTFHAHALSQLRHFWPSRHEGEPMPEILDTKLPILIRIARALPGHYRFTAVRDLATEIEWAKSRGIAPSAYEAAASDRSSPIPPDLMRRVFADYERAKSRANRIDFDDLLTFTADLLHEDEEAADIVRSRKSWFSVDEYQDTSPLQQRLLDLWAGDSTDVSVVGDEDQTIYTFTGATSSYLTGFAARYAGAHRRNVSRSFQQDGRRFGVPGERQAHQRGYRPNDARGYRRPGQDRGRAADARSGSLYPLHARQAGAAAEGVGRLPITAATAMIGAPAISLTS